MPGNAGRVPSVGRTALPYSGAFAGKRRRLDAVASAARRRADVASVAVEVARQAREPDRALEQLLVHGKAGADRRVADHRIAGRDQVVQEATRELIGRADDVSVELSELAVCWTAGVSSDSSPPSSALESSAVDWLNHGSPASIV